MSALPWGRAGLFAAMFFVACDSSTGLVGDGALPDLPDAGVPDLAPPDSSPDAGVPDAAWPDGPDAFTLPAPPTTVKQTIEGVLPASTQDKGKKLLFGLTKTGPGEARTERDDLEAKLKNSGTATGSPISLLYLVHMTDVHINDEESPLRLVKYDSIVQSAYRMNEMFNTQVLDAMVRTINRMDDYYRPFDAAVFTGDLIDNNQQNELGWFIDILDGKPIDPDSGTDEDPLPGPHNDANDPFQAEGLKDPWIVVVGNHDQLVQGSVSAIWPNGIPDSAILNLFPGIDALITSDDGCLLDCFDFSASPSQQLQMLQNDQRNTIALGTQAESAVYPSVVPVTAADIGPGTVASDSNRHLLTLNNWMGAFLKSSSLPPGHGMDATNLVNDNGCYVYDPVPGIPIRVIAIEMVSKSLADGSALGTLRREIYDNFLVPQLDKALADGVLVVLISHHPSWSFPPKGLFSPYPLNGSKRDLVGSELVAKVNTYPNVILHLTGHGHENVVKANAASDGDPLKGYWEVETCSTNFWPQQARIIEIVDNRDGTGTIYSTMLNYDIPSVAVPDWPHRDIASQGRLWSLYDVQMGFGSNGAGAAADRNVLLHFAIPPDIEQKISALQLSNRAVQSTSF